jgi:hypothetical protein
MDNISEIKIEFGPPPKLTCNCNFTCGGGTIGLPCGAHEEISGPNGEYKLTRINDKPCEWIYCKINSDEWKESPKWTWIVNRMLGLGWKFKKDIPAEKYYNKALAEYEVIKYYNKALAEYEVMMNSTYWPWNETFQKYHDTTLFGQEAFDFIERRNECKGGHWVLHTKQQYDEWYTAKGQFLEWIKDWKDCDGEMRLE